MENDLYMVTAIEGCGEGSAVSLGVETAKRQATEILARRFNCQINPDGLLVSSGMDLTTKVYLHELRANVRVVKASPFAATC